MKVKVIKIDTKQSAEFIGVYNPTKSERNQFISVKMPASPTQITGNFRCFTK